MIRSVQRMIASLMLESPYVRDSNMCSLFVVAIEVSSLAEKWLQQCLHDVVRGRTGPFGSNRLELGQVGSS